MDHSIDTHSISSPMYKFIKKEGAGPFLQAVAQVLESASMKFYTGDEAKILLSIAKQLDALGNKF